MQDKVNAIEEQAPELYQKIIKMGKAKPLFGIYETVLLVFLVAVATYLASRVLSEDN